MTNDILMILASTTVTFLLTYFLMAQAAKKTTKAYVQERLDGFEGLVKERLDEHETYQHALLVKGADISNYIDRHAAVCGGLGAKRLQRIELALTWLVVKHDGNPKDLGLD
jgi:hypothetical protein